MENQITFSSKSSIVDHQATFDLSKSYEKSSFGIPPSAKIRSVSFDYETQQLTFNFMIVETAIVETKTPFYGGK